jgi:uncharacterized protein YneF (UPF0154 family)
MDTVAVIAAVPLALLAVALIGFYQWRKQS